MSGVRPKVLDRLKGGSPKERGTPLRSRAHPKRMGHAPQEWGPRERAHCGRMVKLLRNTY
jgi:hypothetical protein